MNESLLKLTQLWVNFSSSKRQHKLHLRWQTPPTTAAVHTICRWCPCHLLTDCVCLQKLENTIQASKQTHCRGTTRHGEEVMRTAANRFVAEIKGEGKRETKRAKQIRDNTHTQDMRNRWGGWRRRRQQNSACTTFSVRKKEEDQKQSVKQSEELNLKLNRSLSQVADTLSLQVANLVDCLKKQHPQHSQQCSVPPIIFSTCTQHCYFCLLAWWQPVRSLATA